MDKQETEPDMIDKLRCETCGAECDINNADKPMKTQKGLTWRKLHTSPPHKLKL